MRDDSSAHEAEEPPTRPLGLPDLGPWVVEAAARAAATGGGQARPDVGRAEGLQLGRRFAHPPAIVVADRAVRSRARMVPPGPVVSGRGAAGIDDGRLAVGIEEGRSIHT